MANLTRIMQSLKPRIKIPRVWQNRLAVALFIATIISGIATYAALHEVPPLGNDPNTVIWLLNLDFILLVGFMALLARRIVALWSGRKRGLAGSHLHVRLVYTFSILAAAPAIIMTVFSAFFFHFGIQSWFSERVETAVYESQAVAEAYLEEHIQVIRADTLAMSTDIDRQSEFLAQNPEAFTNAMRTQSLLRNFSEAAVFDKRGNIASGQDAPQKAAFDDLSDTVFAAADAGGVAITRSDGDDRVRALVKMKTLTDSYLYVGRAVDPKVLSHVDETRQASLEYADLQSRLGDLQIIVTMIFVVVGLLLMMGAIWFGLLLARQLVNPIIALIKTADRVRAGDLTARVPDHEKLQEFKYLGSSFNKMTKRIEEQQTELLDTNRQLDTRRRFTESILEGVTSGVVSLDAGGHITLVNGAAARLLGRDESDLIGKAMPDIMPDFSALMASTSHHIHEGEIQYTPHDTTLHDTTASKGAANKMIGNKAHARTFLVRADTDKDGAAVVTFDDITALQDAQRKAAWADVARRIAHEIKNPLTPIQLSAERLQRKYFDQINTDRDSFSECTDTIIKNVEDIGRMVSEFSDFARMPEPVMTRGCLAAHVAQSVGLHSAAHTNIIFSVDIAEDLYDLEAVYDAGQVRQVINNLAQNAIDSVDMRLERGDIKRGKISVWMAHGGGVNAGADTVRVMFKDNGVGLPADETPSRLTEPYITHKPKGTGLGLAIVKKIMDDHNGVVLINPVIDGKSVKTGAVMGVVFPLVSGGDVKAGQAQVKAA